MRLWIFLRNVEPRPIRPSTRSSRQRARQLGSNAFKFKIVSTLRAFERVHVLGVNANTKHNAKYRVSSSRHAAMSALAVVDALIAAVSARCGRAMSFHLSRLICYVSTLQCWLRLLNVQLEITRLMSASFHMLTKCSLPIMYTVIINYTWPDQTRHVTAWWWLPEKGK